MEHLEGEQYSQYTVERNPKAYMTMRDYKNLPWQLQQPVERNPNPPRSMSDYRDQWMSSPSYMMPPQYTSTPQPPQPPQLISPVEQTILDLTKLVGNVVVEQKELNAQLSQKIHNMENSVDQRLDGLQSEMDKKIDNLHYSISRPAQQLFHQEEENLEEECLTDTILGEEAQLQGLKQEPEKTSEELQGREARGGRGKEEGEEPQKHVLQPIPTELNPIANAKTTYSPLLVTPSTDQVYILPTLAANPKPATPAPKTHASPSLLVQHFKRLVATVQDFATTSKTMAAAHTAWHNGWFGCRFGFGAPEPRHF